MKIAESNAFPAGYTMLAKSQQIYLGPPGQILDLLLKRLVFGVFWMHVPPSRSNFLPFNAVLGEIWPNNRLAPPNLDFDLLIFVFFSYVNLKKNYESGLYSKII